MIKQPSPKSIMKETILVLESGYLPISINIVIVSLIMSIDLYLVDYSRLQ